MMKRRAIILTIVLLTLLLPAGAAWAAPFFDIVVEEGEVYEGDITVHGDKLVIREGALVQGDVVVFGGNAELAGDVTGSVSVFGGNAEVSGVVEEDLAVFGGGVVLDGRVEGGIAVLGGNLALESEATVGGDCAIFGGALDDNSDGISCITSSPFGALQGRIPELIPPPIIGPVGPGAIDPPSLSPLDRLGLFLLRVGEAVGRSLLLAFAAFLVASLMPDQLRRIGNVVRSKPAASGAVGLLTAVAGPSMLVLLVFLSALLSLVCIGLLGFPIVFVLSVALLLAALFGWVAIGHLLGQAITEALQTKVSSPAVTATLGTLLLTLLFSLLGMVRFFPGEGVLAFALLCLGLGATALTQFGTKPYPPDGDEEAAGRLKVSMRDVPAG